MVFSIGISFKGEGKYLKNLETHHCKKSISVIVKFDLTLFSNNV